MSLRIVFAAMTAAVIGAVSFAPAPSLAQAPEDSVKAKAAVQPASENATAGAVATPEPAGKEGKASVERSSDASAGKAVLAKPMAAASR